MSSGKRGAALARRTRYNEGSLIEVMQNSRSLMMRFSGARRAKADQPADLAPRPTTNKAAEKIPVPFERHARPAKAGKPDDPRLYEAPPTDIPPICRSC